MEQDFTRDVNIPGYGLLTGDFTHNDHGYFCNEINGLRWPYNETIQPARATAEEAAIALLELHEAEQD
jgi:hypothetical protein